MFTYIGLIVSGLIGLVFAADLAIGLPFRRASPMMDIGFILCAAAMAYMSWTTMKEQI
jgi:hypothetical protein